MKREIDIIFIIYLCEIKSKISRRKGKQSCTAIAVQYDTSDQSLMLSNYADTAIP